MNLSETEVKTLDELIANHGYIEWTLIGFTPQGEWNVCSHFTDKSILPIFQYVLKNMIQRLDTPCMTQGKETTH